MAEQPAMKIPKDAAQIVFWFNGLPQPTSFLVKRKDAELLMGEYNRVLNTICADGEAGPVSFPVSFKSYPDGRGYSSETTFNAFHLRGITIEYPSIAIVGAI